MRKQRDLLIIIPAFNEEETIRDVITSFPNKLNRIKTIDILVVNDGSTDATQSYAKMSDVIVLSHIINRGLGGAIGTGFSYAKKNNYDIVLTFDADGQHNPNDIASMIEPIINKDADVVIGSRLLNISKMPIFRTIINIFSNVATFVLFGVWTTDSQSGLRAFSKSAIQKIYLNSQGMEVSSEIFREIKRHKLKMKEVPVSVIYTKYSLKKGQQVSNAPRVFWKLFLQRFKTTFEF